MSDTYTLVHVPTNDGWARYDLYKNYEPASPEQPHAVCAFVLMREAHDWLFANADAGDWYLEAGNEGYSGNSIGAFRRLTAALSDAIFGRITFEEHERIRDELRGK